MIRKIQDHHKQIISVVVSVSVLLSLVFTNLVSNVYSATYSFVQSSWNGGVSSSTAVHPTNQTGWTFYSSSTNLNTPSTSIQLAAPTGSVTQTDDTTSTSGFKLSGAAFSSTSVVGTGVPASIQLTTSSVAWATSTLDASSLTVGYWSKLKIGSDGFARIAYIDAMNNYLKFIHCLNVSCSSRNTNFVTAAVDTGSFGSEGLDMVLATDNTGRMVYAADTTFRKEFAQCLNADCSSAATTTVYNETLGALSYPAPSLDLGTDGFARITLQDSQYGPVIFEECLNAGCTSISSSTLDAASTTRWWTQTVMASDGFARVAFLDENNNLRFVQCANATCSTRSSSTAYATSAIAHSLALDNSGNGMIALGESTTPSLQYVNCTNATCSTNITTQIDLQSDNFIIHPSLVKDSSGLARIVNNTAASASSLKYRGCINASCSLRIALFIDHPSSRNVGYFNSIGLSNDLARVSYYDNTAGQLNYAYQYYSYSTSGTFTSGPINLGQGVGIWGTLSWNATTSAQTSITIKARSANNSSMTGATAWSSCSSITNGALLTTGNCVNVGDQYVQYQATLSTTNATQTPALNDITINYSYYTTSGNLISSSYDSASVANTISQLIWREDATLPSSTSVTVSLKAASTSAALASSTWSDFTDSTTGCSKSGTTTTCGSSAIPASMKSGANAEWFQYKVTLNSSSSYTPTISQVQVQYVVNASPQFNPNYPTIGGGGASAIQDATSSDANWGQVLINYSVLDPDTTSDTVTPGYITPSFQYNIGGGWVNIPSTYLAAGDTSNKAVNCCTYTVYGATWNAQAQIPGTYVTNAQIRVTANDNEGANNTTTTISAAFILDTTAPTSTTFTLNAASGTLTFNLQDNSNMQYRFSNNSNLSADGSNASSGSWQNPNATSTSGTWSWTFASSTYPAVTLNMKDIYGNFATTTLTTPSKPTSVFIRDISNPNIGTYANFLSWNVYTPTTTSQFANYLIYRSADGTNYSTVTSINNVNTNYYRDTGLSSSTLYYYKIVTTDTSGDTSPFSQVVSNTPNGKGGGTTVSPPTISSVTASSVQATWATITWTTDVLSNSEVDYSPSSTAFNIVASSTSFVTSHSVTLTGLTPSTNYYYQVKSTDAVGNVATASNGGAGYTFTTLGGTTISAVTTQSVTDNSATIFWNTDRSSDSYVVYASNVGSLSSGAGTTVGSSTLVTGPPYQHLVTITGLAAQTTYYYYVKSTDGSGNLANDTNGGNYYTFRTTYDTKAPTISNLQVPVITKTSAIVTWQTDKLADSAVEYGTQSGSYPNQTTADATLTIYHNATLSNLVKTTTYYLKAISNSAAGVQGLSAEKSFTTSDVDQIIVSSAGGSAPPPAKDTTPPTIMGVSTTDIGAFGATVIFQTSKPSIAFVSYGKDAGYGNTAATPIYQTQQSVKISGLRFGTTYHFQVSAQDQNGNSSTFQDQLFTTTYITEALSERVTLENASQFQDKLEGVIESVLPSLIPPFVGKIQIGNVTENSASASFRTNVRAYGILTYAADRDYRPTSTTPYSIELLMGDKKENDHKIDLTNLSPSTMYHVQGKAYVIAGAVGKSDDAVFITKASKITTEIVRVGNTDLDIRWTTAGETSSFVEFRDLITGKIARTGDNIKTKTHAITINNLTQNTPYEIRAFGYDSNNNIVETDPVQVRTKRDITPPVISNLRIDNALIPGRTDRLQSVISWRTDKPSNSLVSYEEGIGVSTTLANKAGQADEYVTDHIVIITNFKPSTIYRIQVRTEDESHNVAESPVRTILTPRRAESVLDVITKNLQETFGFLRKLGQ